MLKTVFMGTPDFAVPVLCAVAQATQVAAVYTRADAVSKRGKTPTPSPVKVAALELGLEVFAPVTLRDEQVIEQLKALRPDVIIVAAYGMILPKEILDIAPYGCINLHGSILPKYRGAAPIQHAILDGESETGVAVMQMEEGLDTGPYSLVATTTIDEKNTDQLTSELSQLAAELIVEALAKLEEGSLSWEIQDESLATYASKINKEDVSLHPNLSTAEFTRRVRASSSSAPARLSLSEHQITVMEAREFDLKHGAAPESQEPATVLTVAPGGVVVTKREVILGTLDGAAALGAIKPDGKKVMNARDFVRGTNITSDSKWE